VEGKVMPLLVYAKQGIGVKRYSSGPTPLGYERSCAYKFNVTEFRVETVPPLAAAPEECKDHYPNCFLAWVSLFGGRTWCEGTWGMLSPIDIPSWMPGRNRKLVKVVGAAMDTGATWWWEAHSSLQIWVDGAKKWDSGDMPSKLNEWNNKEWSLNISIPDNAKKLELKIWEKALIRATGSVYRHVAGQDGDQITLFGVYYTDEPPPMADVSIRVLDRQKMTPIKGAYVALKVGDIIKADGYTDTDGKVLFQNIEEGGYTLYVYKEGYHELSTGIDVEPPKVDKTVYLTPVPSAPIPWTWIAIGVGVVVVGGVAIAALTRRKPEERIVVVR
jgi:hypothetical protein